jgi:hypothetical protein
MERSGAAVARAWNAAPPPTAAAEEEEEEPMQSVMPNKSRSAECRDPFSDHPEKPGF